MISFCIGCEMRKVAAGNITSLAKEQVLAFHITVFLSFIVKCYIADNNIADGNLHQPASN